jgi:hypothetical protein
MRPIRATVITITLAAALTSTFACNGQLDVGEPGSGGAAAIGGRTISTGGKAETGGTQAGGVSSSGGQLSSSGGKASTGGNDSSGVGGSVTASGGWGGEPDSGSGGSWLDAFDPVEAVPLSSEGCPMGPLHPNSECNSVGQVCGYEFEGNYQECDCLRRGQGVAEWDCDYADSNDLCGEEVPEPGSDCFGVIGLSCWYPPGIECTCGGPETWECTNVESVEIPDPPASVDPTTIITEMSAQDREAWCEWFSTQMSGGPGHLPVSDLQVENGFTYGGGMHR